MSSYTQVHRDRMHMLYRLVPSAGVSTQRLADAGLYRPLENGAFGARARVFAPCKGCVPECFWGRYLADIRFRVEVSDATRRTIGFVPLMYSLYG